MLDVLPGLPAPQRESLRRRGITARADLLKVAGELPVSARAYLRHRPKKEMSLEEALSVGAKVIEALRFRGRKLGARQAEIVGSARRRKSNVKDLDVLIIAPAHWHDVLESLTLNGRRIRLLESYASGERRRSIIVRAAEGTFKVDLFLARFAEKAFALYHYTGSRAYNIRIRAHAKMRGWKLNQYGLFSAKTNRPVPGSHDIRTEKQLAEFIGVSYRSPAARTD